MTTDKDLSMDGQTVPVVFTTKGIDITPNKDKGVYKVVIQTILHKLVTISDKLV